MAMATAMALTFENVLLPELSCEVSCGWSVEGTVTRRWTMVVGAILVLFYSAFGIGTPSMSSNLGRGDFLPPKTGFSAKAKAAREFFITRFTEISFNLKTRSKYRNMGRRVRGHDRTGSVIQDAC